MDKRSLDFLLELLSTPSPSGFEMPAQVVIRRRVEKFADTVSVDVHGNLIAALNPGGRPRVMLAGHVDQIGFMVRYLDKQGYIYFAPIGGVDATVVPGLRLTIHGRRGPVEAVVGRKPIHLMKPEERGKAPSELSQLWLDIGAGSQRQAEGLVQVGDPITYLLEPVRLAGELIASPGLDDKIGAFVVMEALRLLAEKKKQLKCAVFAVSTVQEELGLRGARTSCFELDPQVGVAVDVTHASDCPDVDKKVTGEMSLGKGPALTVGPNINPVVEKLLQAAARRGKIPIQREGEPRATGTDANAIQISRAGVAAGLLGIPCRYMHTPVEVVSLKDAEAAFKLLTAFCLGLAPRTSFTPY
jgi:putative aminopeptidase FrvX